MYERCTDRTRKVMQLAARQAQRLNHEYIGTEHILLGLLEEGRGVATIVLENLDVDPNKVRSEVEKIVQFGPGGLRLALGRMPHTPQAKKAFEYAVEEARGLNHNYLGTEHLLLGLLRERNGIAAQVLMNLGLDLEDVREKVLNVPRSSPPARAGSFLGGLLRRLFGRSGEGPPETRSARPANDEAAGDEPPSGRPVV